MGMMAASSSHRQIAYVRYLIAICLACACLLMHRSSAQAQSTKRLTVETQPASRGCPEFFPNTGPVVQSPPTEDSHHAHGASLRVSPKYNLNRIGSRGVGKGLNLYSVAREHEIGRQLADEADSQVRVVNDPIISDYVSRLAEQLVAHSDLKTPMHVKVVDDDEVNIFTLPGGFLYVHTGLLLAVHSEAELAGVIAHEVAHTAARHATRKATRKRLFHAAIMPLSLISGGAADLLLDPLALMKFSRDSEREADLLGLEYMYAAGYDPIEFVHFFERLRAQENHEHASWIRDLLNTHPPTEQRIRRAQKEIKSIFPSRDVYVITTSEFDAIRARVAAETGSTGFRPRDASPTLP